METKETIEREHDTGEVLLPDEKGYKKFFDKKKLIIAGILIFAILISIFVAPYVSGRLHIFDEAEKVLDSKRNTVVAVTATAATISVAVAAIPGDVTTPIANQIAELDIFFIIVLIAIYLLKVLLVVSTTISFKYLFPAACILCMAYVFSNNDYFKKWALKIFAFGLVIILTVPISVGTMNAVDTALRTDEKIQTIATEVEIDEPAVETTEEEKEDTNWWGGFWNKVTDKVEDVKNTVVYATKEMYQQAKDKFSELIDIVASLIITCCVIPLLVVVFLVWILKMLFGINISVKNVGGKLHDKMSKVFNKAINKIGGDEKEEDE